MFLGHFGVAYAAKRVEPRIPLWVLFAATQLVDIGWMFLILLGVEHVEISPGVTRANALHFTDYPYTHSLAGACVWSIAAMAAAWLWYRKHNSPTKAIIIGAIVLSHYLLDVIVHVPDLTLAGEGTATLGFGLWNSIAATLTLELGMLAGGLWLYYGATRPIKKGGIWGQVAFMLLLTTMWLPTVFGSVPPSTTAIGLTGIISTPIILFVANWLDHLRVAI